MYQVQPQRPVYQSPEPPRAPGMSSIAPVLRQPAVVPVSAQSVQPAQPATAQPAAAQPANGETVQKIAMADDGTWIIGELHYVHAEGGLWEVRYASYDQEDKYGGAVLLAPGVDMSKFHEGDTVFVRGQIMNEGRSSKYVAAPLYKATSVDLNERAEELKQ
jgi:hypothetical protein